MIRAQDLEVKTHEVRAGGLLSSILIECELAASLGHLEHTQHNVACTVFAKQIFNFDELHDKNVLARGSHAYSLCWCLERHGFKVNVKLCSEDKTSPVKACELHIVWGQD